MQAKHSNNHQCQIDCTNHDEVINALQLKSKDLYYFWRNYQWLYNKYYAQQKIPQKQVVVSHEAQEEKQRVLAQNRKLRMEIQLLKKQLQSMNSNTSNKRVQQEYQREIMRLKTKCDEYEKIREKQIQQITNLSNTIRGKDEQIADAESKWKREQKKQEQRVVELQTTIDGLRAKLMNNNPRQQSLVEVKQAFRRQTIRTQSIVSRLEEKCYEILEHDLEQTRKQFLEMFLQTLQRFFSGDLSYLITEQEDRT